MATEKLDRQQLIETIHSTQGVLSQAARVLGVSLPTIYNYRDKYKSVATAIDNARDRFDTELLDESEIKLREAVREGKAWAIRYTLDKRGAKRGYVSRQEVEHSGGVTIEMDWGDGDS